MFSDDSSPPASPPGAQGDVGARGDADSLATSTHDGLVLALGLVTAARAVERGHLSNIAFGEQVHFVLARQKPQDALICVTMIAAALLEAGAARDADRHLASFGSQLAAPRT